jgi:hypothetical protein
VCIRIKPLPLSRAGNFHLLPFLYHSSPASLIAATTSVIRHVRFEPACFITDPVVVNSHIRSCGALGRKRTCNLLVVGLTLSPLATYPDESSHAQGSPVDRRV